jgi:hypothetical protein
MYDRTILFSNFHPSQISKVQSIALPETPVTVESFTSFFSAFRDSARTFDEEWALARTLENMAERANGLINIAGAKAGFGLTTDSSAIMASATETTRSIPDKSNRVILLSRIASEDGRIFRSTHGFSPHPDHLRSGLPVRLTRTAFRSAGVYRQGAAKLTTRAQPTRRRRMLSRLA